MGRAPGEVALAYTIAAVVVVCRTFGRDSHALACQSAPGISWLEQSAMSAAVVGLAAKGNLDALPQVRAPAEAGVGAGAVSAVVVVVRTLLGDDGTVVCGGAPGEPGFEGQAISAVVMRGTALWDYHAGPAYSAPAKPAGPAFALTARVVAVRTVDGDTHAGLDRLTVGISWFQCQAIAAAVVGIAADGYGHASGLLGAPGSAWLQTETVSAFVVSRWTLDGNSHAADLCERC